MTSQPCTLRELEYDGSRYCGTHFGFTHRGGDPWCDQSPAARKLPGEGAADLPQGVTT